MRSLKELYQIALDNFDYIERVKSGLCGLFFYLFKIGKITNQEHILIESYFAKNKPTFSSKFFWKFSYNCFNRFWWKKNKEGYKQRKKFLEYLRDKS